MANNYREYLAIEFDKAVKAYQDAKAESIKEINRMSVFAASEYGAAYVTHIDKISVAAGQLRAVLDMVNVYECMNREEGPVLTDEQRAIEL